MASGHRGSTRHHAHQTVPIPRTMAPQHHRSLGPRPLQKAGHNRKDGTVLPNATPLYDESARAICWRAASKHTTDDTPTCQCATNATRRTTRLASNTAHTTTPLKMKQKWRCPACSDPNNTTPGRSSGARLLGGRLGDGRKPLRGPRYGSSNQGVEHGLQRPPARQSADALDKDLTNSERQCGRMQGKVDQHTASRFARNSLLAPPAHAPWARHPTGRKLPSADDGG
jgi:hypothetical protein